MTSIAHELFNSPAPADTIAVTDDYGSISYGELTAAVLSLGGALRSKGVEKGDRVALICTNRHEYVISYYATMSIGAVYVPLNWRLHESEHVVLMQNAEPTVLIAEAAFAPTIELAAAEVPSLRNRIAVIGGPLEGYEDFAEWLRTPAGQAVEISPSDAASIVFTSGTTSDPKGVVLTHDNIVFDRERVAAYVGAQLGDVALHVSPLFHQTSVHTFVHIGAGSTVRLIHKFDPECVFDLVAELRPTYVFLAPTMLYKLLDHPRRPKVDLSSFRRIGYGAAPITGARLRETLEIFGPILVHAYGLTEATSHVSYLLPEEHLTAEGSVGRGVDGIDVQVRAANGEPVSPGSDEIGEIVVRGRTVMQGYWRETELTAETIVDGWLLSGDMATVDADGFIYIVDRKKDLVISGGVNIYPRDVENVLAQHPDVAEVAVIGLPDPYWGEALTAVVVPRTGAEIAEAELTAYCRELLGGYQVPRRIEVRGDLPRNLSGKILKRELRKEFTDGDGVGS